MAGIVLQGISMRSRIPGNQQTGKAKGKRNAVIIDAIVLPNLISEKNDVLPILRGELARAWEFANLAENRDVTHKLWQLGIDYGVEVQSHTPLSFQYGDSEE